MNNQPQMQVRGYELRERIGTGGFGEVYRAYQPSIERDVAIKIIRSDRANQPEFIRKFELEARLIASVEHPHIVPLFDFWRDPSGAYLVMRWLRSGSLKEHLKSGPLSVDLAIKIVEQITSALAVAHRHNIIHRDLKPENILLDDQNNAYLTDFGIAAVMGQSQSEDNISGSIEYIAPEQLQGYPPAPSMDIYSLGLVIYELLTGEYAFAGSNITEIINKHLTEPVPRIDLPEIPEQINYLIQKATAKDPDERYVDVRDVAREMVAILNPSTAEISEPMETELLELENPYKGLSPFDIGDIEDFFGRDDLVTKLIRRLEEPHELSRFLVIIGPSGSGKSSVVRAGLIPRLWNDGLQGSSEWYYCNFIPGNNPIEQLETSLLSVASSPPSHLIEMLTSNEAGLLWAADRIMDNSSSELFIFIDQFEEIFTLVSDEAIRAQFLDLIYTAVTAEDSRVRIVATLRADFTDRPLEYVEFGELVRERSELMVPMKPAEIEQAITGPASRVGLIVDTDLVAAMVSDISHEPGALPLLQYTLTVLYDLRQNRTLTLSAYHQIGGIQGALATRAEQTFSNLPPEVKSATKQVFLRLITLGEGTEDTRRRVLRTELSNLIPSDILSGILEVFGDIRVLTFDIDPISRIPTVEVAHEALIREWHRLREWLDESRNDIRTQRSLAMAVTEWKNADRDSSFLLSGTRLIQFEEWLDTTSVTPTDEEINYIQTSTAERSRLDALEAERKQRETIIARRAQNFRRASVVLGVVGVLAVIATIVAIVQASNASNQVVEAQAFVSTAQTQVAVVGSTLTPADLTIVAANQQIITVTFAQGEALENVATAQAEVLSANSLAGDAQTQVYISGETLTPIPETLTPAALTLVAGNRALATADNEVKNANELVGLAQTQASNAESTLAPIGSTLTAASNVIQVGQTDVARIADNLDELGTTLTPVGPTLTSVANLVESGSTEIANANNIIANTGKTLTPVVTILTQAANNIQIANTEVAKAQLQVIHANATLSPLPPTLTQAAKNVQSAEIEANNARNDVSNANATLTPIVPTLTHVNSLIFEAQSQANLANTEVAVAREELTNIPPTLNAITTEIADAELFADGIRLSARAQDVYINAQNQALGLALAFEASLLNSSPQNEQILRELAYQPGLRARYSDGNDYTVWGVAISPDNTIIASTAPDNTVILRSMSDGTILHQLAGHDDEVTDVDFSPDGKLLVSASVDTTIIIWDVASGEFISRFASHDSWIHTVRFSPNGQFILSGAGTCTSTRFPCKRGEVLFWNVTTMQVHHRFSNLNESVASLAISPDGLRAAFGSPENGNYIYDTALWDIETGEIVLEFNGSSDVIRALDFSPDGQTLLSGAGDGVTLWNVNDGTLLQKFTNINGIYTVSFGPGEQTFVSGSNQGEIHLRDVNNGNILQSLEAPISSLRSLAISNTGQFIVSGSFREILVWDISPGDLIHQLFGHENEDEYYYAWIYGVAYSPNENKILSGSRDGTLILWDSESGKILDRFIGHSWDVTSVAFSLDGNSIISGSCVVEEFICISGEIIIWDASTGDIRHRIQAHTEEVRTISLSPDGANFISGSLDGTLLQWDIITGELIKEFERHDGGILSSAFSLDGQLIYTGTNELSTSLFAWNAESGDNIFRQRGDGGYTNSVVFSPTKQQVASAGSGRSINLREPNTGEVIISFEDLASTIYAIDFSPDGKLLLSGSSDGSVTLWDTETGQILHRYEGHTGAVFTVAFSPDGQTILTGSQDESLILWRNDNLEQLKQWILDNRYLPSLSCEERITYGARPCIDGVQPPFP